MKVTHIETYLVSVPLAEPVITSGQSNVLKVIFSDGEGELNHGPPTMDLLP